MNKTFFMALMLASGMALAQSSGSSPDQQQPSTQQPPTDQQQPSTPQNQPTTGNQTPTSSGQNSITGCLKGSDGSWVLVAEGQSTPVTGDSATLSPHNGHQVQLKGTQGSDGSFQVTDVVMIAESCPSQQTDASSDAGAGAGAAAGAVGGAVGATANAAQNAGDSAANATKTAAQDTAHAVQGAAAPAQSPAPQATTPQSTTPQSTTPAAPAAGDNASGQDHQKLPQTASPLPLLGLLGLGSLVSGLVARRKK
ncbi:MAG TPA: hypothetical protein VIX19_21685 [Terriglobales bacterium]